MTSRLVALCFDAADPVRLARFWADALAWEVRPSRDDDDDRRGAAALVPTDATPFELRFLPSAAPKTGKNPIHLDLTTQSPQDQEGTVRRLLERGGAHVDVGQGPEDRHVVLADPEGNELCIIEPENSFLAGCGRLGSITADGSPRAGAFWSDVLGWPLVWDQDEETAIRSPAGTGPYLTWGPPVPPPALRRRLHLHLAPSGPGELDRLVALGARPAPARCPAAGVAVTTLTDPDGNELCLEG